MYNLFKREREREITMTHKVVIRCPNCIQLQNATVKHTEPFYTYIHECSNCKYVITESDWDEVKGTSPKFSSLKNGQSICYGDGSFYHFRLTEL
jgi:ribosomal protein L37AE/L43A